MSSPTIDPIDFSSADSNAGRPARLWPTLLVLAAQAIFVVLTVTPSINNFTRFVFMMGGPLLCAVLFATLLAFASRLRWWVSLSAVAAAAAIGVAASRFAAPRTGIAYWMYGVPLTLLMLWLGLALTRRAGPKSRFAAMVGLAVIGWAALTTIRVDGIDGGYIPEVAWRWSPTAEQRLLATLGEDPPASGKAALWEAAEEEWPAFRGPGRDSQVAEAVSPQDWGTSPPRELWRREVGPGWSSMTIVSGRLFTQEQRGEAEVVTAYDAVSGEPIWVASQPSRFEDVVSGAGPRATPTYADGRVFAYGARAILTSLDAATGDELWKHDLMQEVKAELPVWGFSSSPAVVDGITIIYAGGEGDSGLMAFDAASGELRWSTAGRGMNFSSPQVMEFDGERTVVFVHMGSARGFDPQTGVELWKYDIGGTNTPIVQPQQVSPTDAIIPLGDGIGVARISVARDGEGWKVTERWSSRSLKPSFNDYVVADESLFGFDNEIFAAIDAATGKRHWKRGRYGFGQALLLESAGQIIVTAEGGDLVLLEANAQEHIERGRIKCFEGKTWNHPAFADGKLYVRNSSEMVCFDLAAAPPPQLAAAQ